MLLLFTLLGISSKYTSLTHKQKGFFSTRRNSVVNWILVPRTKIFFLLQSELHFVESVGHRSDTSKIGSKFFGGNRNSTC